METADELFFFKEKPEELKLYRIFREKLLEAVPEASFRVQKTQITFTCPHVFACVSFLKTRKSAERPRHYITITFGLLRKAEDSIVDIATEPYPGRWTHHVTISEPHEVNSQLMAYIREAAEAAREK